MALFGKDDRAPRPEDAPGSAPAAPRRSDERSQTVEPADTQAQTILGKGSRVEGKLTFEGSVRVDGEINGEIDAQESVLVGESASVSAQIRANTVIIKGEVSGDVTARKRVELRAPAKLIGNISTPSLVIQDGVVFEGHCSMGTSENKADKKVTPFPREDRPVAVRMSSEATK